MNCSYIAVYFDLDLEYADNLMPLEKVILKVLPTLLMSLLKECNLFWSFLWIGLSYGISFKAYV